MSTAMRKMLRDILFYKGRTILTLASFLIGIAAVGAVLSAYFVLNREMDRNFMSTNPSSIVLKVSNLDARAKELIRQAYSNAGDVSLRKSSLEVEYSKTIQARIGRGDGTYGTIWLRTVPSFDKQKIDTFTLEKGRFPQGEDEMALERDCLRILKNIKEGVGESVLIKLPGGLEKELELSGRVHAPGLPPASMENYSYGFLSMDALNSLGYKGWYDEIRIIGYDDRLDRGKMRILAGEIVGLLEKNGYAVNSVSVPVPGRHPHADQLDSLLFLLQAFAVISLLAACLIIINMMNYILSKQSRQIAVMKAVGASTASIAIPYLAYVVFISAVALILSFPVSITAGNGYSEFAAGILNFTIFSREIPIGVFAIQTAAGILIPLAAAAYPIFRNCAKSVKDGLAENVNGMKDRKERNAFTTGKGTLHFTNSKFVIPVNNLFRKKGRTILATLALLTGGVLYMTSQNIIASIDKTIDGVFRNFAWDYSIRLSGTPAREKLENALENITGVSRYESWGVGTIRLEDPETGNSVNCSVRIVPEGSKMVEATISKRLTGAGAENAIVVNNGVTKTERWIRRGGTVKAEINGKKAGLILSEPVTEVPAIPVAYISAATYERLFGGQAGRLILACANTRDPVSQRSITREFETVLKTNDIEISENLNVYLLRKAFVDHLHVVVTFLMITSMLAILVGGLSIGSAVGISISERRRETGVLRAVGAVRRQMVSMVLAEVFLMGVVSWVGGMLLSHPVSKLVGNYFGQIFLDSDLLNSVSVSGCFQWLAISVIVSVFAGLLPAWKSASAPLTEMLAYE